MTSVEAPGIGRLPLPDRIQKTIIGRLERLTERAGARAAAAVIGREFEFPSSSARPVWGNDRRRGDGGASVGGAESVG